MDKATEMIVAIVSGAFVVAIVALLFSKRSQFPTVISNFGSALSSIINAADSPFNTSNQ